MASKKTSKGQKKSSKKSKSPRLLEHRLNHFDFNQPKLMRSILADCVLNNDMDTFKDVLLAFVKNQSKTALSRKTELGRRTIYDLLDDKKKFNPEWETLCSLLKAI